MQSTQSILSLSRSKSTTASFLLIIMIFCIIGSIMAFWGLNILAFWITFVNFVFIIRAVYWITHNWLSSMMQFSVSFFLYSLSGPFAVLYYPGRLPSPFYPPYQVGPWLLMINLSLVGFAAALLLYLLVRQPLWTINHGVGKVDKLISSTPFWFSVTALAITSSIGELINLARIGFFQYPLRSLFYKALAQVSMLIPADRFVLVAAGALGLWWSLSPRDSFHKRRHFISWLFLLPGIAMQGLIANRSGILFPLLAFVTGYTLIKPFKTLKIRYFVAIIVIYFIASLVMAIRNPFFSAIIHNQPLWINVQEVILRCHPAFNEFGVTFGTFSQVIKQWNREPFLGTTYLRDLLSLVPGFLLPFERPKAISKVFIEDEMIYGRSFLQAHREYGSSVRSSQIAIIYINFRELGAVPIHFLLGFLLLALEAQARKRERLFWVTLYPPLALIAFVWHTADNWVLFPSRILMGILILHLFYFCLGPVTGKGAKKNAR